MSPHQKHVMSFVALAVVAVLAVVGYVVFEKMEDDAYQEGRSEMSSDFGRLPTMEYGGKTYRMKANLTTMLLIGYDRTDEEDAKTSAINYRNGGQSDFLLLMVVDNATSTVRCLQIDRDLMTRVPVLGVTGNPVGNRLMQICLSHAYGATPDACNENTVTTVEMLLGGPKIDCYVSLNISSVGRLNHLLGGVTVPIEDDMSSAYPEMVPGATIRLTDAQATYFVRARMGVGDGTNVSRMRRQRAFIEGAEDRLMGEIRSDGEYAARFINGLSDVLRTDMSRGELINLLNRIARYRILDVETLPGTHTISRFDFVEFYADENAVTEWVLSACYDPL